MSTTRLLVLIVTLLTCACSGPIGLGTVANFTETVCVVPSAELTLADMQHAADIWHAGDARVNLTVRNADDGPRDECDTVVTAEPLPANSCGKTSMAGSWIRLDNNPEKCDILASEPHELGHLLLGGDHSENPDDVMFRDSWKTILLPEDIARLAAIR